MATKNIINPNQCMSEPIESILEILATTSIKLEEVIEKLLFTLSYINTKRQHKN